MAPLTPAEFPLPRARAQGLSGISNDMSVSCLISRGAIHSHAASVSCPVYSVLGMSTRETSYRAYLIGIVALKTINEVIAPAKLIRRSRNSVLPPSIDQFRSVVDHSLAV